MQLHVHRWGSGPRVVLVHGGVLGGRETWRAQRPLTERWSLLAPDRPGHGGSPDARQDFEPESVLIADQLLVEPSHLVGYSYGGIVSIFAALRRPENVRSLTLIEPPASDVARDDPVVAAWAARTDRLFRDPPSDPRELLAEFFRSQNVARPVPDPLPISMARGARALAGARPPSEAKIPLEELAASPFPLLVVSGGHMEAYEKVCTTIAMKTNSERAIISGETHLVPDTGPPFNELLETFWNDVALSEIPASRD